MDERGEMQKLLELLAGRNVILSPTCIWIRTGMHTETLIATNIGKLPVQKLFHLIFVRHVCTNTGNSC